MYLYNTIKRNIYIKFGYIFKKIEIIETNIIII